MCGLYVLVGRMFPLTTFVRWDHLPNGSDGHHKAYINTGKSDAKAHDVDHPLAGINPSQRIARSNVLSVELTKGGAGPTCGW